MSQPGHFKDIKGKLFRVPLSMRGWPKPVVWLLGLVGVIYVLNPTAGIFELLPDNLPIIGNLDEGLAYLLVYYGVMEFFTPYINFGKTEPPGPDDDDDEDVINADWEE